ncbi:HEAT repeat protein [Minicystis rosea]|nr:HEAT repeat protein [Minicystis rosea]
MSMRVLMLSEAERRRAEDADRWAALGASGVPELVEMLADPSWTVRRGVVASLAALGDEAVSALCEALVTHRDNEARIAGAVDALVASTGAVDAAVIALSLHDDPAIIADAAHILGRRHSAAAVARLAELAAHRDDNVAVAAIEALGRVGGRAAVGSLVQAVTSGNFFRTFPAIDVLGRSGDPRAIEPLATLLPDPRYMLEAARALGRSGSRSAVDPLVRLLAQPSAAITRVAAAALADLRERHRERYGLVEPIDDALRRAAPMPASARRLAQALDAASQIEQAAICALLGALGGDAAAAELTALVDGPPNVAAAAAAALVQLGGSADARLFASLQKRNSEKRRLLLPLVTGRAAAPVVIACLDDPDPEVRAAACDALARIGAVDAAPQIFALLGDGSVRVVHAAISAVQSLGGPRTEALALAAASEGTPSVRRAALRILAYFGYASAREVFLANVADPDPRVRDAAIQGLAFVDDPRGLDALLDVSRAPDAHTRATSARTLGQCAPEPRVVTRLLQLLDDEDSWCRYYACQALGRLGCEAAAERVSERLGDSAGHVRVAAVEALAGMRCDTALAALLGTVEHRDLDVRRAALLGLGLARRPEALPALVSAATVPDTATRLVAVSSLAGLASPEALGALSRAASDEDPTVSAAALGILTEWPGVETTRVLVDLLRASAAPARVSAALSAPVEGRIAGILEALAVADDELAVQLAAALARMRMEPAVSALCDALRLPNVAARRAVATTLAALGTRCALTALEEAKAVDPDPDVRRICALVVAQWAA